MSLNLSERLETSINEQDTQKLKGFFEAINQEIALIGLALFGSFAKNSWTIGSDLDVLVIGRNLPEEWFEKTWSVTRHNPGGLDIFVYSEEEFHQMTADWHSILLESLYYGEILFDPEKILQKAKDRILKAVKNKLLLPEKEGWNLRPLMGLE